jgi:ATP-binding cassette subfamily C (CFTR/MRP) protein 1
MLTRVVITLAECSGGQKARVAIGRTVYRDADVTLLDDCLSAVDAHVGRDIFDKCIIDVLFQRRRKGSNKKRTVILVTNALQYLSNSMVDRIVVMKNGRVVEQGSFKELVKHQDSHFKKFLDVFNKSMTNTKDGANDQKDPEVIQQLDAENVNVGNSPSTKRSERASEIPGDLEKKPDQLMTDEMAEREIGKVGKEVYLTWAKAAGGLWVVIPIFCVFAAGESMKILSNWWLTFWSHEATPDQESQLKFLAIYGLINLLAIIADFCRMFCVLYLGLRASASVS